MSRSRKKHPAGGIAKAGSDKWHKSHTSRVTRHRNKLRIQAGKEPVVPHELVNQFASPKDGHTWYGTATVKKYPKLVRK